MLQKLQPRAVRQYVGLSCVASPKSGGSITAETVSQIMSEASQQDADVAARIDTALDELYNLEQLVGSYDEGKQVAVQASFANAARSLEGIEAAVPALEGLDVPVKLLDWIDAGKDADSFYQALMRECIGTAQVRPALDPCCTPALRCLRIADARGSRARARLDAG